MTAAVHITQIPSVSRHYIIKLSLHGPRPDGGIGILEKGVKWHPLHAHAWHWKAWNGRSAEPSGDKVIDLLGAGVVHRVWLVVGAAVVAHALDVRIENVLGDVILARGEPCLDYR